jgi:hypothetical protein
MQQTHHHAILADSISGNLYTTQKPPTRYRLETPPASTSKILMISTLAAAGRGEGLSDYCEITSGRVFLDFLTCPALLLGGVFGCWKEATIFFAEAGG